MPIFDPENDTDLSLVATEISLLEEKKSGAGLTAQEEARLQHLYDIGQFASSDGVTPLTAT